MSEFKKFLQDEMERRGMTSAREFARFVDVAPSTVTRCIDEKDPAVPGLDFLIKVATATGVSITSLVAMAYPDLTITTRPSPSAQILAQQIEQLPEATQEVILAIIRGTRIKA